MRAQTLAKRFNVTIVSRISTITTSDLHTCAAPTKEDKAAPPPTPHQTAASGPEAAASGIL